MGKLKLKKLGKAVRRAGGSMAEAAGDVANIAEAVVLLAGLVEKVKQAAGRGRRRPASARGDPREKEDQRGNTNGSSTFARKRR